MERRHTGTKVKALRIALLYEMRPEGVSEVGPFDLYYEFETLETVQAIALGLEELGHTIHLVDYQATPLEELERLRPRIDLVFNTSVGIGSRFRELMPAALCEILGIPYTGGDPMAQALAANKHVAKLVARSQGIATPDWLVLNDDADLKTAYRIGHDVLLKPIFEGSSIGVIGPLNPVANWELFQRTARHLLSTYSPPLMVENFVSGCEITICMLGNPPKPLPPLGLFLDGSFDLESRIFDAVTKANAPNSVWHSNPPVPRHVLATVQDWAKIIHMAIGCRDLSRSDFRISPSLQPFFIEINATPQIAPCGSSFSTAAAATGLDFKGLLDAVVSAASDRYK